MARFVVRQAPDLRAHGRGYDLGLELPLDDRTLMIGRAKEAGLSLNSPNVSKKHAEVTFKNRAYFIRDLGSTQGTRVNGTIIPTDAANPVRLNSGDRILLADTTLEFIDDHSQTSIEATLPPQVRNAISPARQPVPSTAVYDPPKLAKPAVAPPSIEHTTIKPPEPASAVPSSGAAVAPAKKGTQSVPRAQAPSTRASSADSGTKAVQPVYLLLDGSGSMAGEPIEAVKAGVSALVKLIKQTPACRDNIELSVFFFGSAVQHVSGFFSPGGVADRQMAAFKPSGLCALGDVIQEALRVHAAVADRRRPPLFVITLDGVATDLYDEAVRSLHNQTAGLVIACELGELADASPFYANAQRIVAMKTIEKPSCESFMRWVGECAKIVTLEPLPADRTQFKWPTLPEGLVPKG